MYECKITDLPQDCLVEILSLVPNSCVSWAPTQMGMNHPATGGIPFARDNPTKTKFSMGLVNKSFQRAVRNTRAWRRSQLQLYIRRCKQETNVLVNSVSFPADRCLSAIKAVCSVMRVSLMAVNLHCTPQSPIDGTIIDYLCELHCSDIDLYVNASSQMVDYSRLLHAQSAHLLALHLRMEVTQRTVMVQPPTTSHHVQVFGGFNAADENNNDGAPVAVQQQHTYWRHEFSPPTQLNAEHSDMLAAAISACPALEHMHLVEFDTCTDNLIAAFQHTQLCKLTVNGDQTHTWFIPQIMNATENQEHPLTLTLDRFTSTMAASDSLLEELHPQVLNRITHLHWSDTIDPEWLMQHLPDLFKTNQLIQSVKIGRVMPYLSIDDVKSLLDSATNTPGRKMYLSLPYSEVANDYLCPLNELANQHELESQGLFQWVTKRSPVHKQAIIKYNKCNIHFELKYV